jgi:hypothetical protein
MSRQNKKQKNRLLSFLGYTFGCSLVGMALGIPLGFLSCFLVIHYRIYLCDLGRQCDDVGDFAATIALMIFALLLPIMVAGIIGIFVGI